MNEEIWKPVLGFEGLYDVSSLGNVRSIGRQTIRGFLGGSLLTAAKRGDSPYLRVTLCRDGKRHYRYPHVLVTQAFYGPRPPFMEAAHKNGVHVDNRETNLGWKTRSENQHDRTLHGTSNHGERNGHAIHNAVDVERVRDMHACGVRNFRICEWLNVSAQHVSRILLRKRWALS